MPCLIQGQLEQRAATQVAPAQCRRRWSNKGSIGRAERRQSEKSEAAHSGTFINLPSGQTLDHIFTLPTHSEKLIASSMPGIAAARSPIMPPMPPSSDSTISFSPLFGSISIANRFGMPLTAVASLPNWARGQRSDSECRASSTAFVPSDRMRRTSCAPDPS